MNKKNFCYLVFVSIFSLLFFSCVDCVQAISYKDGNYTIYHKLTLSKTLIALADENPETVLKDFGLDGISDSESSMLPENVEINKVNTDLEVGAEFKIKISARTQDETEKSYLPTIAKNKIKVPFFRGLFSNDLSEGLEKDLDDSYSDDYEEFAEAILSSSKARVLIGKNIVPSIEICYFEGKGGQNYSIPIFDYGESWCLEIPFIVFFEPGMYDFENVVIIKKVFDE